jgi:hypothetical protein
VWAVEFEQRWPRLARVCWLGVLAEGCAAGCCRRRVAVVAALLCSPEVLRATPLLYACYLFIVICVIAVTVRRRLVWVSSICVIAASPRTSTATDALKGLLEMVIGPATIFFILFLFLSRGEMNLLSRSFLLCNMIGLFMGSCSRKSQM